MPSFLSQPCAISSLIAVFLIIFTGNLPVKSLARYPHVIGFRSPNLYPEGVTWDPSSEHFIVGSFKHRIFSSVSDAGVAETLIFDSSLPENVTILGVAIDSVYNRLLAAIHATAPLPQFNALAAYDLKSLRRIFLVHLPYGEDNDSDLRHIANDVDVDFSGNAFVTDSSGNLIWKVNKEGEASIFSKSPMFTAQNLEPHPVYGICGLNGIAYLSKGYLLTVHSSTGKMYKVDEEDGTARLVLLNEDMKGADGIAVRSDGAVLVVSYNKLWFLKSQDSWGQGVVYDKIDLEEEKFPTSVVVGGDDRTYVLYGRVIEALKEGKMGSEEFSIEEVKAPSEIGDEKILVYVLIGFGLAYFLFWRFQMRKLVDHMSKKTN